MPPGKRFRNSKMIDGSGRQSSKTRSGILFRLTGYPLPQESRSSRRAPAASSGGPRPVTALGSHDACSFWGMISEVFIHSRYYLIDGLLRIPVERIHDSFNGCLRHRLIVLISVVKHINP